MAASDLSKVRQVLQEMENQIEEEEDFFAFREYMDAMAGELMSAFELDVEGELADVLAVVVGGGSGLRNVAKTAATMEDNYERVDYEECEVDLEAAEVSRGVIHKGLSKWIESAEKQ